MFLAPVIESDGNMPQFHSKKSDGKWRLSVPLRQLWPVTKCACCFGRSNCAADVLTMAGMILAFA